MLKTYIVPNDELPYRVELDGIKGAGVTPSKAVMSALRLAGKIPGIIDPKEVSSYLFWRYELNARPVKFELMQLVKKNKITEEGILMFRPMSDKAWFDLCVKCREKAKKLKEESMNEEVQEETIGNLVVQKDIALVKAITDTRASLLQYLDLAEKTQLKKPEDKQIVTDIIASVKNICKPIVELIEPIKKQANEQIEKILSVEKVFITYVPPNQASKTRTDTRFIAWKIIDILSQKLNAYLDYEEEQRRKEEKRLQEFAEKERQKELERIGKKLDTLLDKVSNLTEQKRILEEQLNQDITDEEAQQIRMRIEAIETKLKPSQEKIQQAQTKLEEKAMPITVAVDKGVKVAGLSDSFYWEVEEITNVKLICKQIWEGTLPPACVTINTGKIKTIANDMVKGTNQAPNIPGVQFIRKRKIVVRSDKGGMF